MHARTLAPSNPVPPALNTALSAQPACPPARLTAIPPHNSRPCSDPAADVASFKEGGGHVLVGTPGRLDDIMQRCATMDLRTGGWVSVGGLVVAGLMRVGGWVGSCMCMGGSMWVGHMRAG